MGQTHAVVVPVVRVTVHKSEKINELVACHTPTKELPVDGYYASFNNARFPIIHGAKFQFDGLFDNSSLVINSELNGSWFIDDYNRTLKSKATLLYQSRTGYMYAAVMTGNGNKKRWQLNTTFRWQIHVLESSPNNPLKLQLVCREGFHSVSSFDIQV